jgi:hypothetical protein
MFYNNAHEDCITVGTLTHLMIVAQGNAFIKRQLRCHQRSRGYKVRGQGSGGLITVRELKEAIIYEERK